MSNVSNEITRIENAKQAISASIASKGVSIPLGAKISDLSGYVDSIEELRGEEKTLELEEGGAYTVTPSEGKNGITKLDITVKGGGDVSFAAADAVKKLLSNVDYIETEDGLIYEVWVGDEVVWKMDYLVFIGESEDFSLTLYSTDFDENPFFYYSTDKINWQKHYLNNGGTFYSSNKKLYLRGQGITTLWCGMFLNWIFSSRVRSYGGISSLFDYTNRNVRVGSSACKHLFSNSKNLVRAPDIDFVSMPDYCCEYMFSDCTSLVFPPKIYCKQVSNCCYATMFSRCTNLLYPVDLSRIAVNSSLAISCFRGMYQYCTKLLYPSKLNSTRFNESSCQGMYLGCTSIKLSTTQDSTYRAPYSIPTNKNGVINGTQVFADMFSNTGGTFTGTPTINTTYYGDWDPPVEAASVVSLNEEDEISQTRQSEII